MSQEYFEVPHDAPHIGGIYGHYKHLEHEYQVTGLSLNSDTDEWHVEYVPLYNGAAAIKFNRVLERWLEKVIIDGHEIERYPFIRMG